MGLLGTTTQESYYSQSKSWTGDGTGGSGTLSFNVAATDFPTRPTQQVSIQVFINNIEISRSNYSYNGTAPGDTSVDSSYNLVFTATGINTAVQETNGAPKVGMVITLREIGAAEQYGNYQFIGIQDLVNNFIVSYVGLDKIIHKVKRADVYFHAQRCIAELSYDTLRSHKSQEIEIAPSLTMPLPQDFVNHVKLSYTDKDGVERLLLPARKTSNPTSLLQDDNFDYIYDSDGNVLTQQDSDTWEKYKTQSTNDLDDNIDEENDSIDRSFFLGGRYGLEPENSSTNGLFYIDATRGRIFFSGNLSGKIITLKYISDTLGTDGEIEVHKFAEEAVYKWLAHAILATRSNTPEYLVNRFKKERFAEMRKAKIRLSNYKIEEFTQIMRGKSKQIKH
tara:strand:- start:46 stop:1224 length:1179 start_codon:yes stop_codon:yes gene_type:complete